MRHRSPWSRGLLVATLIYLIASANTGAALASRRDRNYAADEVIVRLHPSSDVRAFALSKGLDSSPKAIDQLGDLPIYRLKIADGKLPPRKALELEQDWRVQYAEPNYDGQLPEARLRSTWVVGGDTHDYTAQWASATMHLAEAHAISRGAGVTIALLDTGVDASHPALDGHLTAGYDFVDLDDDPSEEGAYGDDLAFGHGTHVAGLLALAAPEAKIMPLRTLDSSGVGTIWAQVQAIRFAVMRGADVINMSYSFSQPSKLMNDAISHITCAAPGLAWCATMRQPWGVL